MKAYIYKITIDDKNYIGSCRNPNERLLQHIKRNNNGKYKHLKLYKSFDYCNFNIIEIIEDIDDNNLVKLEQNYIDKFDTINNGLNEVKSYLSKEEFKKQHNKISNKYRNNNKELCNEKIKEIRNLHILNQTFRCEICNYNFGSNRDLQRHKTSKSHLKNIV